MNECSLTIGNFDGMHLGHQALCASLKKEGKRQVVVTFDNHPSIILKKNPTRTLITKIHKSQIIKNLGISEVVSLPFTEALSLLSAQEFLVYLRTHFPFDVLLLGTDARLGHKREAGMPELEALGKEMGFRLISFSPITFQGEVVSSSCIRSLIAEGNLAKASLLLGREYSFLAPVQKGEGKGRLLGFKTLNFSLDGMVHPPLGVYVVNVRHNNLFYKGIANVGVAPTLKHLSTPLMEVHVLDFTEEVYGALIEVTFIHFLREERHFPSEEALKKQIAQDIHSLH